MQKEIFHPFLPILFLNPPVCSSSFIQIINIILSYVMAFSGSDFGTLISIVIGIMVLTLLVKQHNTVNALYNEINNFVSKA